KELFSTERWALLAEAGALPQRPLWASTGVKDPAYPDTLYVTELVAPGVVNTMPEKTLDATFDHGTVTVTGDTVTGTYAEANATLDALENLGVSYNDVVALLESEGLDKFVASWKELLGDVEGALASARSHGASPAPRDTP
ncbi:transaldolase family protein, partial [Arthrobacter sp. ISL-72]|uniref:transaldolase family protein n=1 Tax=Arthrobacter sp. ISL-72 TaxID=2819114 RepID=UPI001C1639A6